MKIAVLNNAAPFIRGGAEYLAETLVTELTARGHQAELIRIPLRYSSPQAIAESMVAAASMRVPTADRVIALKFPAYLVPHHNKIVWLLHQFRQVYDFWDESGVHDAGSVRLREAIMAADAAAFDSATKLLCNSQVTADRLMRFNGFAAEVLLAPHSHRDQYKPGPLGDRIVALGRINGDKRQRLLVEALAHTRSGVQVTIAGPPEQASDTSGLLQLADQLGVRDRLELVPRFISEQEKIDLLHECRAAVYLPVDEDSYGYVTAEAMLSGKPVVTCSDSGGVLELVEHQLTGLVSGPEPRAIAEHLDLLAEDPPLARELRAAALERVRALDLSWERAIDRLLA